MNNFRIVSAQIPIKTSDIQYNINSHLNAIHETSRFKPSVIIFPELSLTGYIPEKAEKLSFTKDDQRLQPLVRASREYGIIIVVGTPLRCDSGQLSLASLIFKPDSCVEHNSKIHLHGTEQNYFQAGKQHKLILIHDETVALGICADMSHSDHAEQCTKMRATVYAGSVLISKQGYDKDSTTMASTAKKHNILLTMANHSTPNGSWTPAGQSAAWDENGLLAQADSSEKALLISERSSGIWKSYVVYF
ncbi:MAG: carbon-nitrogen hydrolase family protein [Endozoicomonas sp.]|uniref:carbon-nitrogen hydrolase family protein n=1 Tax=Endozoicomonas sp. TaxID=1892382 RepID=UPI003D9BB2AE